MRKEKRDIKVYFEEDIAFRTAYQKQILKHMNQGYVIEFNNSSTSGVLHKVFLSKPVSKTEKELILIQVEKDHRDYSNKLLQLTVSKDIVAIDLSNHWIREGNMTKEVIRTWYVTNIIHESNWVYVDTPGEKDYIRKLRNKREVAQFRTKYPPLKEKHIDILWKIVKAKGLQNKIPKNKIVGYRMNNCLIEIGHKSKKNDYQMLHTQIHMKTGKVLA